MKISLEKLLNIDYEYVVSEICAFIKKQVVEAGLKGAVIGLSGGIDSSTTAFLTVRALGAENVLGLIMPYRTTPKEDVDDARKVAEILGIKYVMIDISEIRDTYARVIPDFDESDKVSAGNLLPRIRMMLLYYYANKYRRIVVGTGDRSEILIGYFTKYGDGGVDILPIGSLYKTQVRKLGQYLGVPESIVKKPSSPRLWPGHLAEEELGLRYEEIDLILHALFDLGLDIDETVRATGLSRDKVVKVVEMYERSRHKRKMPPTPLLDPSRLYRP